MKESIRFILFLTLAKTCLGLGDNGFSGFSSPASPSIRGWASRSRDALARSNSALRMIPIPRTNSGRGQFSASDLSSFGLSPTPSKRYETNDGDGGKTVVEEFSSPNGNAYGRRITRSGSGYFPSDTPLALRGTPPSPFTNDSNAPKPSPRYSDLGTTLRRFSSLPRSGSSRFDAIDTAPAKPSPPPPSEPEEYKPRPRFGYVPPPSPARGPPARSPSFRNRDYNSTPAPAPVPIPSPLGYSNPSNGSFKRNEEPPVTAPKPYGNNDSNGSAARQPPQPPKPAPRSDSFNRNTPSARGAGTPIIVKENLPNGGSVTIKMIVDGITEEEVGYLTKHARNALTAEFYFPHWKCALVSRLS